MVRDSSSLKDEVSPLPYHKEKQPFDNDQGPITWTVASKYLAPFVKSPSQDVDDYKPDIPLSVTGTISWLRGLKCMSGRDLD